MHLRTVNLRVIALAALASLLATAAVTLEASAPAVGDTHSPSPTSGTNNSVLIELFVHQDFLGDPYRDPLDETVLELFDGDGVLVAESVPGTIYTEFSALGGGECESYEEDDFGNSIFALYCYDLPTGDYEVGARDYEGWNLEGDFGGCYSDLIGFEPLDTFGSSFSLGTDQDIECAYEPYPESSLLYLGIGTTAPYSYTLDLSTPPTTRIYNAAGTVDVTLETFEEETVAFGDDGMLFGEVCLADNEAPIGWYGLCLGLPGGEYMFDIETPEGLITGEMFCEQETFDLFGPGLNSLGTGTPAGVTTGRNIDLEWNAFASCLMYMGGGVPIYVDILPTDGAATAAELDKLTVEAYDSNGMLVATAKDPSPATCPITEAVELPIDVVDGVEVADSSNCAVLWVKPPHNITTGDETATETYTIGLSGANVKDYTVSSTDLPWNTDGEIDPIGGGSDDILLDFVQEPLPGAEVELTVDYLNGTFSSGGVVQLAVELEDEALADGGVADDGLADTGARDLGMLGALAAALVALGLAAVALTRRRATSL